MARLVLGMNVDNFLIGEWPGGEKWVLLLPYFTGSPREVKYRITLPESGVYNVYISNLREPVGEVEVKGGASK